MLLQELQQTLDLDKVNFQPGLIGATICYDQMHIGFLSLSRYADNCWHLSNFSIDEDLRGQGLGSLVLQKIISEAKARYIVKISLSCRKERINFYKRHGFDFDEEQTQIFIQDRPAYHMELIL